METEIGFIPDDWEIKRLSELDPRRDAIKTGPFGSLLHSYDYSDEGRPLLLVNSINDGRLVDTEYPLVNFRKADELKQFWLEEGDIVYTRVGEVGRTLYVSKEFEGWMFSGQTLRIRIRNEEVNNRFVELFLRTPIHKKIASQTALGSTRESINTSILSDTIIPLPKRNEQDEIVKTIYCFDQKIDLLHRQNETIESIAQALFKHWFVDFEYPDEDSKPYRSSGGMMAPSERSDMGDIPEGWRIGQIKEFVDILPGFAFESSDFVDNGKYRLVTIKNVQDGRFEPRTKDGLKKFPEKMPEYCKLKTGDILLSLTGNIGRICHVIGENYLLNQRVAKLQAKDEEYFSFVYLLFKQRALVKILENISSGTAQQNLSTLMTAELETVIPSQEVMDKFAITVNPMIEKILNNLSQIQSLASIRDALLPKLMRGQIRVIE